MPTIKNLTGRPLSVVLLKRKTLNLEPWGSATVDSHHLPSLHQMHLESKKKLSIEYPKETASAPAKEVPAPKQRVHEKRTGKTARSRRKTFNPRKGTD